MFAPLLVFVLLEQGSPVPSSFTGHWEGKITYSRPNDPWPVEIVIVDLVVNEDLTVSGKFGKPAAEGVETRLGGDGAKISPEGEFNRILLWIDRNPAFCHFRGKVELSKDGLTLTGKKFIVRDFGKTRGNADDEDRPATLELHRIKSGGHPPPHFLLEIV
ncbi:MAG: hypothetical protein AAB563_01530 [Patescibacteria group bacterium]